MKLKLYFILHRNAKRTGKSKNKKKRRQKLLLKGLLLKDHQTIYKRGYYGTVRHLAPSSYFWKGGNVTDENQKETFYDGLKFHRVIL
jgi:hypothetical protein